MIEHSRSLFWSNAFAAAIVGAPRQNFLAESLVIALRSRRSSADITHILSSSSTTITEVVDTLHDTFASFERESNGLSTLWTLEILGVATEVYR
jgi:hypothetical protein